MQAMHARVASRRPAAEECSAEYHAGLIAGVPENDAFAALQNSLDRFCEASGYISADQLDKVHPPYGWTLRQVLEHCVDAERVFGYRLMRFAAGDGVDLPGWDENHYAAERFGLGGGVPRLVEEMTSLRTATVLLLRRIRPICWDRSGTAEGKKLTVRALAFLTAGHLDHHTRIVRKRLGLDR